MSGICQACAAELDYKPGDVVGRTAECPQCRADLHACKHCVHYDPRAYNQCREPQAERVDDRVKANFCEYFQIRSTKPGAAGPSRADDARSKLEGLFKKRPDD